MKKTYPKLKDLDEVRRMHLAWRLDHDTWCGYGTAGAVCRLQHKDLNDLPLNEVLEKFDCSPHKAKILAHKVITYPKSWRSSIADS